MKDIRALNTLPYFTKVGGVLDMRGVQDVIAKYSMTNKHLNYEFKNPDDITLVFITGIEGEEGIPLFKHPLVFKGITNNTIIATDMRTILSPSKIKDAGEDLISIRPTVRDYDAYLFTIVRTLTIATQLTDSSATASLMKGTIPGAFGKLMSMVLGNSLHLTNIEKVYVEAYSTLYYMNKIIGILGYKDEKDDLIHTMSLGSIGKLLNLSQLNLLFKDLDLSKIDSVDEYVDGLKSILDTPKLKHLDYLGLLTMLRGMWYGPNNEDNMVMCIESPATLSGVLYSSLEGKGYRKQNIGKLYSGLKSSIDTKEFLEKINRVFDDVFDVELDK